MKPLSLRAAAAAALPACPGVRPCPLNLASWAFTALTALLASLVSCHSSRQLARQMASICQRSICFVRDADVHRFRNELACRLLAQHQQYTSVGLAIPQTVCHRMNGSCSWQPSRSKQAEVRECTVEQAGRYSATGTGKHMLSEFSYLKQLICGFPLAPLLFAIFPFLALALLLLLLLVAFASGNVLVITTRSTSLCTLLLLLFCLEPCARRTSIDLSLMLNHVFSFLSLHLHLSQLPLLSLILWARPIMLAYHDMHGNDPNLECEHTVTPAQTFQPHINCSEMCSSACSNL